MPYGHLFGFCVHPKKKRAKTTLQSVLELRVGDFKARTLVINGLTAAARLIVRALLRSDKSDTKQTKTDPRDLIYVA